MRLNDFRTAVGLPDSPQRLGDVEDDAWIARLDTRLDFVSRGRTPEAQALAILDPCPFGGSPDTEGYVFTTRDRDELVVVWVDAERVLAVTDTSRHGLRQALAGRIRTYQGVLRRLSPPRR